jgi:hypothetical protein
MATRGTIGYETPDGGYVGVYIHYDSYPDNIGPSLHHMHHADVVIMVEQALRNGGMRCLEAPNTFELFNESSERDEWLTDEWPSCPEDFAYRKRLDGRVEVLAGADESPWTWRPRAGR